MDSDRAAWEQAYRQQGNLWAEHCAGLPDLPHGSRVLELGCGNARSLPALAQRGWIVTALDFSETAVTAAMSGISDNEYCNILLADARNIPVHDDSMDMVIAAHVIGHMSPSDRMCIAAEISRVLKPGGIVVFREFSRDDFRFMLSGSPPDGTVEKKTGIRTHYFTEAGVRDLFTGMICISIETHARAMRIRGRDHRRSEICAIFRQSMD